MTDPSRYIRYEADPRLRAAWEPWDKPRYGDEAFTPEALVCALVLIETLGRELATLTVSERFPLLSEKFLYGFKTNQDRTFGSEGYILDVLAEDGPARDVLTAAAPPTLPSLRHIHVLTEDLLKHKDTRQLPSSAGSAPREESEGWREAFAFGLFLRNTDAHKANYKGEVIAGLWSDPAFLRFIIEPLNQWTAWMVDSTCDTLSRFRLATVQAATPTQVILQPGNERVSLVDGPHEYLEFAHAPGHSWYLQMSEGRVLRAFPRIHTVEELRSAFTSVKSAGPKTPNRQSPMYLAAKRGTMVVVIGPEFGLPTELDHPGARHVINRIGDVLAHREFEVYRPFLTGLASERLRIEKLTTIPPGDGLSGAQEAKFVGRLTALAVEATLLYADAISSARLPLVSCRGLPANPAASLRLSAKMMEVVRSIEDLTARFHDLDDLGEEAIARNLKDVAGELSSPPNTILPSQVEWLTDLVWHALRFDAPFFPDSESTAAQLALSGRAEGLDKALRVHATASGGPALVLGSEGCAAYLPLWLARTAKRVRERGRADARQTRRTPDPHVTLVRALQVCLETRGPGAAKPVFVIDTTFDQRLSEALAGAALPNSLVFPVTVGDVAAWCVRDFPNGKAQFLAHSVGTHAQSVGSLGARVVVVKPFGAPLETLGTLSNFVREEDWRSDDEDERPPGWLTTIWHSNRNPSVTHRVLWHDISILRDLVRPEDSLPPGLRHQLHKALPSSHGQAEVFFLGYPLDEQGRRMRIVADIQPAEPNPGQTAPAATYYSQPPPAGLTHTYLMKAKLGVGEVSLADSIRYLAAWLDYEGRTP